MSGEWDEALADFYESIGKAVGIELDLQRIQKERPQIAALLQDKKESTNE